MEKIKFKYEEELAARKLQVIDLPEDAQTGIDAINDMMKAVNMATSRQKEPSEKLIKKIKAMDKWVYYEILDFVQETDNNSSQKPTEQEVNAVIEEEKKNADEVAAAAAASAAEDERNKAIGKSLDNQLEAMHKTGRDKWDLESIKASASAVYNVIFQSYKDGEENGVDTTFYSLLETEPKVFTLTKK